MESQDLMECADAFHASLGDHALMNARRGDQDLPTPFNPSQALPHDGLNMDVDVDMDPDDYTSDFNNGSAAQTETPELEEEKDYEAFMDNQAIHQARFCNNYNLRSSTKNPHRTFTSDRVDHDETGDYDPAEKANKKTKKPQTTSRRIMASEDDLPDGDQPTDCQHTETEERPIVTITFKSEAAKRKFSELPSCLPTPIEQADETFDETYRSRLRKTSRKAGRPTFNGDRESPPSPPPDLSGHPVARGCWACQKLGFQCSLLEDEYSWPCEECHVGGEDCQMIQEPVRKMSCEHCNALRKTHKWLICSFDYEDDVAGRCKRCVQDGQSVCIAGPDPSAITARIRYADDGKTHTNEKSIYRPAHDHSCRACQDAERICSFAGSNVGERCTACDMDGANCEPIVAVHQHKASRKKKAPKKKKSRKLVERAAEDRGASTKQDIQAQQSSDQNSAEPLANTDQTLGARMSTSNVETPIKNVTTCFHHPVVFNVEKQTDEECNFCANPAFGMIGSGEREIQVIELEGGRGWQEVGGRTSASGTPATRVCEECTTERMEIVMCDAHDMRKIPGLDVEMMDCEAALDHLLLGDANNTQKWCSICCSLAVCECCTVDQAQEHVPQGDCGLALCEECATDLQRYHGNLQAMLDVLDAGMSGRSAEIRADYGLLHRDGLLMRFVLKD